MKKYIVVSSILLALGLAFQNCSPSLVAQNDTSSAATGVSTDSSSSATKLADVQVLEILNNSPNVAGVSKSSSDRASLLVDLSNGDISVVTSSGQVDSTQKFCLSAQELSDVKAILNTAKLCEESHADPNAMCSMVYKFPYAKLHSSDSEVTLGESRSSCQQGPDLCGDHKALLQSFTQSVLDNLDQKVCN